LRFFERDLRVKITAILLAFVVACLLASILISHILITSIVREDVKRSGLDSARLTGNLVEAGLEGRADLVELLAGYPRLRDPSAPAAEKQLLLIDFIRGYPLGEGAVITDTNGKVVTGTGALSGLGSASGTSWFERAQTAQTTFTFVHQPSALAELGFDSPLIAVSTPERDTAGQIFAYLTVFTSPDDITESVEAVKVKQSGYGFLMTSSGAVISGFLFKEPAGPGSAHDALVIDELVERMSREGAGNVTIEYGGKDYLVAFEEVGRKGLDWSVGVVVPSAEAFSPANKVALALFGLGAVILVLASLAAFFLGRSIARPLDELVTNAEKVGSGDLTGEVVIRTRDQIGSLAAAFLRMRDYLRSAVAEAGYASNKMSMLAEEQSAATEEMFSHIDEMVDSVVALARNMESQTEKIQSLLETAGAVAERGEAYAGHDEIMDLATEAEILAEVGTGKAVEIAASAQEQRSASRDLAAAARRLSEMAADLREMSKRFKICDGGLEFALPEIDGCYLYGPAAGVKPHRAPVVAAGLFADDGYFELLQGLFDRLDVPRADVRGRPAGKSRSLVPRAGYLEHLGAANDLAPQGFRPCPEPDQPFDEVGNGRVGELTGRARRLLPPALREHHVGQAAHLLDRVEDGDCHA
jgi:HAMP domain-containing protein